MRLVIKPLNEDYQVKNIRVTELESILYPPEFIQTDKEKQNRTFSVWHAMWTVIQCYGINKETLYPNLKVYGKVLEEYEWLSTIGDIVMEWDMQWICFWDIDFFSCSNDYTMEVEYWDYLFNINGQSDVMWVDWDKWFLWDIKTAAARWKWLEKKIQCEIYPLMLEQLVDEWSINWFYYFIFLKNKKKGVCQVLKYEYNREESIQKLNFYLSKYIQHENLRNSRNAHSTTSMNGNIWSNDQLSSTWVTSWHWFSTVHREGGEEL